MNWLFYIFGGIIFWAIAMIFLHVAILFLFEDFFDVKTLHPLARVLAVTSPLAVWIWFCWRYISG